MKKQQSQLPERKHPRMKYFDYSSNRSYFVTICADKRKQIFSFVVDGNIVLTPYGEIAKNELISLEIRYPFLKIENYVIMPNHIHLLMQFMHDENTHSAGASQPALHTPNLQSVISSFKSLSTRLINKRFNYGKVYQTSFYEHVVNDYQDWSNIWDYIENNPKTWQTDELYK